MDSRKLSEQYKLIYFKDLGDERGDLVVIEGEGMDIPFDIKRVFYMYGSDSTVVRGQHANRETEFLLVNVGGSSKVRVDNGRESEVIVLDKPGMGLYLPAYALEGYVMTFLRIPFCWYWQADHYDGKEYIRDYQEYLKEMKI